MKDKITIKAPEGYRAVYSEDGREVTFEPVEKKLERFKPDADADYYAITYKGTVDHCGNYDDSLTDMHYQLGNCFETKAQAQHMADYHRMSNLIFHACKLVNPDHKFVMGDQNYSPAWINNKWEVDYWTARQIYPSYVATHEECEQVISLLNEWGVREV